MAKPQGDVEVQKLGNQIFVKLTGGREEDQRFLAAEALRRMAFNIQHGELPVELTIRVGT